METNSPENKTIAINTFSQFLVRLFSSSTTLVTTLLISFFLGTGTFGSFIKITTFVSFFYLIADFGINGIFIKDYGEKDFGNFLLLRILGSALLIFLVCLIVFFLPYNSITNAGFSSIEKLGIILFSLTIGTQSLFLTLSAVLQKNKTYAKSIVPSLVSSMSLIVLVSLSVYYKNIFLILFSYVISGVILLSLLFRQINKHYSIHFAVFKFWSFSKGILIASLPLALMLFLNLVYAKADILILSVMKPTTDVGIYGFSYRFFEFAIAIPAFFANSMYPLLLEKKGNKQLFEQATKKYSLQLLIFSFVVTTLLFAGSPILKLLRADYQASVLPLQILSLSLPFFFLTSLLQWVLVIKNKKYFLVAIYAFSMIINISANVLFIPHYSYIASSVITVVCEVVVFLAMLSYLGFQGKKNIRI